MRFLNPKTDFAFKKIFGSEESRDILLSFLNAVLDLRSPYRIQDVTILDPYQAPRIAGMKDTYVDVRAVDETGKHYIIEMQVLNVPCFEQRILYNACKTYANQIMSGEDYRMLADVIALTITDFVMFPDRDGVMHKYKLRAEDGHLYSDDLELVFVELPKFKKDIDALSDIQDKWFYFLQHAKDLTMVPATMQAEAPLTHAFTIANRAALTPEELEAQERREIFIQDQRGARELAEIALEKGIKQGIKQGLEEGVAKGEHQAALRIARLLLPVLADDAAIAAATGLSLAEVQALRQA